MSYLGRFEDYGSMVRASEQFVARLQGRAIAQPKPAENVADPRLPCGHESTNAQAGGCRKCRRLSAERKRDRRLPDQYAAARAKADALEAELIRKGMMKCG